ncbi:hypothetical protein [Ralstonia pseudosolanacearum]|uniref:hypothetical protein n=1 Tax=Ralstonia pseudosolanacearum TaxID=1310165 RepID=UPI0033932F49
MNQTFRYVLGAVALTGFLLSLLAHVMALLGTDLAASVPAVWDLHFGIFVVFIPFVLLSRKGLAGRNSMLGIAADTPRWVVMLGATIFAYAMVNFFLFTQHTEGGNAVVQCGKYVLLSHGKLIRELTASEYTALKANELRGFSGHWLLFYFMPAAYFLLSKPDAERGDV